MAVHEICLFLFEICLCFFFKFSVMTVNEVFYSELCALHLLVRLLQYNTESPFWCMRTVLFLHWAVFGSTAHNFECYVGKPFGFQSILTRETWTRTCWDFSRHRSKFPTIPNNSTVLPSSYIYVNYRSTRKSSCTSRICSGV